MTRIAIIGSRPECEYQASRRCGPWAYWLFGLCENGSGFDEWMTSPDGGDLCEWLYGHFDARGAYGRVGG